MTETSKGKTIMPELSKWEATEYEVISVAQADKMLAVYAQRHPTEEGKFELVADPIHFVGVAKVTTLFFEKRDDEKYGRQVDTEFIGTKVVGLDLCEGFFQVCNEASNFAGLMREGDDIDRTNYCLSHRDYPLGSPVTVESAVREANISKTNAERN